MPALYRFAAETSTVLVGARSTMGPIAFESRAIDGELSVDVADGRVDPTTVSAAWIDIGLGDLQSGNELYDAELRRRIHATRYPTCHLELTDVRPLSERRFALSSKLTFHDTTRAVEGSVEIEAPDESRLLIVGEKTIDIRDFNISAPSIMMLKIYPDVRVQMFLEARVDGEVTG